MPNLFPRLLVSMSIACALCPMAIASAAPIITIVPSLGPDGGYSPSFAIYRDNAINALQNNRNAIGDPTTSPEAYAINTAINPGDIVVTGGEFNSWRGTADPTGAFASETGNRIHFGLKIIGNGARFSLSNLDFALVPGVPGTNLDFSTSFTAADSYSLSRVGIDYGMDGLPGGGDDVVIDSGSADQLIDEFYYAGVGSGIPVYSADPGITNQEKINTVVANLPVTPFTLKATYTLFDGRDVDEIGLNLLASGGASVAVVPEAGTALLITLGCVSICVAGFLRQHIDGLRITR